MTAAWPMESKRLEALTLSVRYAKEQAADLRQSDPQNSSEWLIVADIISTEGGLIEGRDLWPTLPEAPR